MKHSILREQQALLFLIVGMTLLHVGAAIFSILGIPDIFYSYNLVPADLITSLKELPSLSAFSTLATTVTAALLHADASHLGFNMFFLWIFGALLTELVGARWMLALFFLTAIGGAIGHTVFNPDSQIRMLGASGAVSGLEGAYIALAVRWILPNPQVWPIASPIPPFNLAAVVLIGVMADFGGLMNHEHGVAYAAHLGGLVTGMVIGSFFLPRPAAATAR